VVIYKRRLLLLHWLLVDVIVFAAFVRAMLFDDHNKKYPTRICSSGGLPWRTSDAPTFRT